MGVVHDTFSNRVYAGVVGEGETCDGKPIAVRDECNLQQALIGTGFLPDAGVRRLQADLLRQVLPRVRDVRRSGCPSLDICGVASGVLDVFYERYTPFTTVVWVLGNSPPPPHAWRWRGQRFFCLIQTSCLTRCSWLRTPN